MRWRARGAPAGRHARSGTRSTVKNAARPAQADRLKSRSGSPAGSRKIDVTPAKPPRRDPADSALRRARSARPAQRERDTLASLLPAPVRQAHAPPVPNAWVEWTPTRSRRAQAFARLPVMRKHRAVRAPEGCTRCAAPGIRWAALSAIGWRGMVAAQARAACSSRPARSTSPRAVARLRARGARDLGRRLSARRPRPLQLQLPPHAGRRDDGSRARMRSAAPRLPAAWATPSCSCRRCNDLRPHGYIGTPSFLKILVEKAADNGARSPRSARRWSAARRSRPSLRDWLRERGIEGYQAYATADVGLIAYETVAREGLVVDEGVLLEIVRPGTDDPVPDGEVGEVVVTVLSHRLPAAALRHRRPVGRASPARCPSGRTQQRIKGWMGRADPDHQGARGMLVHPSQVADVVRRHAEIVRARVVIEGEMASDRLTFKAEVSARPERPGRAHRAPACATSPSCAPTVVLSGYRQPAARRQRIRSAWRSSDPEQWRQPRGRRSTDWQSGPRRLLDERRAPRGTALFLA